MILFITKKQLESKIAKRSADACDQFASLMGAEIHDDLIQKLSIFRLYIDRIERSADEVEEIRSLAVKMRSDFEQVTIAVKNISRILFPERIEGETLDKNVQLLCRTMEKTRTAHIQVESKGTPVPLDSSIDINIIRIIQELIHNAFRHSSAWHVWVRLLWSADELVVEVEDDGSGFSKISEFIHRLKTRHNTLRMRAVAIGGLINYSHGLKGLLARLELPLRRKS